MNDTTNIAPPADEMAGAAGLVLRVGIDVQSIAAIAGSIERHGRRYLDRVFTAQEVESCGGYDAEPGLLAPGLAARFCAKEATLKVLRPLEIIPEWRDIEVVRMPGGWVRIVLTRAARDLADKDGLVHLEVSLTHDGTVAAATVVGLGKA